MDAEARQRREEEAAPWKEERESLEEFVALIDELYEDVEVVARVAYWRPASEGTDAENGDEDVNRKQIQESKPDLQVYSVDRLGVRRTRTSRH